MNIDLRYTALMLVISAIIAAAVTYFSDLPYIASLGIVVFAILANGSIATLEDGMPGGLIIQMGQKEHRKLLKEYATISILVEGSLPYSSYVQQFEKFSSNLRANTAVNLTASVGASGYLER